MKKMMAQSNTTLMKVKVRRLNGRPKKGEQNFDGKDDDDTVEPDENSNKKLFWKWLKRTKQGVQGKKHGIQNEHGEMIWDENGIRKRWRKDFEQLYDNRKANFTNRCDLKTPKSFNIDEKPSTETLEGIYDNIQHYRQPPFEPTLQEFKSDPDMDHCFCDLPKDRILSQNNHYLWNIHQNAYVVLTDGSQLTSDGFEKLPDQIMYPYAEPYDLQKTCVQQLSLLTLSLLIVLIRDVIDLERRGGEERWDSSRNAGNEIATSQQPRLCPKQEREAPQSPSLRAITVPPDQDSNLPILGSLALHETSALANYATEVGFNQIKIINSSLQTSREDCTSALVAGYIKKSRVSSHKPEQRSHTQCAILLKVNSTAIPVRALGGGQAERASERAND
uniref:Uncharacterized protein n=1 Tax=Timema genevievae TaxID=629358 RepID=A0A7R9JYP8_TIMGE|nr:unnamed protein product [Timema genevievae]